ncbi:unnamed protein product [Thlaspi arvense]|uniref:TF-B3 domain-containing protein n=1 Tax=Thlaspi arvense TaxID=13288 RepID=A0AAU9REB4_THLAR|nr:unnamed protein product [Thlaspi arvense]
MISDEEAARILLMLCRSPQTSPKRRSVVVPLERDERICGPVPRKKRGSNRIHTTSSSSSSSTAVVENVSKEDPDPHIHNGPLMESPTKPTKNRKKRPPLFPPMEKQPKKAKGRTDRCCLAAAASSSGMREPPPEWLLRLMASKNGADPKKIIDKELTATDLSSGHNRLSMPFSSIVDLEFLNPVEERTIQQHVRKTSSKGVDAKLVSSDLREFDVNLRRWNMKKKSGGFTPVYNLVTGWNRVVKDCGLKEKDNICLWSFHSDGELHFALVPPPPSDSGESKPEETSSALVIYDKSINDLPSNPVYNLVTTSNQVVKEIDQQENDNIRLWSFRSNGKHYFALVLIPTTSNSGNSKSGKRNSALVIHEKT